MNLLRLALLSLLAALALPAGLGAQSGAALDYRLDASASEVTARVGFFGL